MTERYDQILEENANLKKALQQAKSVIERTSNDYETLKQIHEEFKIQQDRLKRENDELSVKVIQLMNDKKELEMQFDATIRNLKIAIDLKQREIEEVQAKIIPSFDQDMLRIKIINELEIPHRNQLEAKQEELERMQEQVDEYKRQINILNSRLEIINKDHERDIKSIKERHHLEVSEFMNEIKLANEKIDDQKDKETIRKLRREVDELKQKFFQKDQECEELRRERDRCREEKNECLIKFSKQVDSERNEKRIYKAESEKLAIRVRFLDEESKKNKIKFDSILSDSEIQKREKETLSEEVRKKDDLIHQLQRRITELEDEHVIIQAKAFEQNTKVYNEERDKFLEERNRSIQLQKEFDQIKQSYNDLNEENKQLRNKIQKDLSQLRQDNMTISEERDKLRRQKEILEKDNIEKDKSARQREEELNELERELENVRRKYRESQQRIQNLESNVDTLQRYKSQIGGNVAATAPIIQNPSAPSEDVNQLKKELEAEKKKNQKLKDKLKQANEKIMDLLQFKLKNQAQQTNKVGLENRYPQVDNKLQFNDISNIQQQYQQSPSVYPQNANQPFNMSYQNTSIPNTNNPPLYLGQLTYEDERILQEINRASDMHKYNYY
ncbi:hypothetical protein TTHERM_00042690 (macronuclear) [Tetrahymena thermophila SB210]|uniref:Uncharacterized protein n=1 Tax=Tetrahymena thermophila (strain SB210) TaxID=312017 RepID=Q22LU7_TETTS|nr:hypothetical protein TTHERM_00042690 [Tetrahymena thermophila SB210]EAR86581.1 hypothetical protein TTHERM_00042690 [Tetrahymena thermophila SB210]|eukprot:XP_977273.1 hypothetical protein TTHERM_00042690 [Tetrahymena thermophila SB210]